MNCSSLKVELFKTISVLLPPNRFPMVAVSVALAVNKEVMIGIIYNPVLDLLYTARKGKGAFVNDSKLKVGHPSYK